MYYVSMTDRFMSGWGKADSKINKLVIECETKEEADIVKGNAKGRSEMSEVVVFKERPEYGDDVLVSFKTKVDYPSWFEANRF